MGIFNFLASAGEKISDYVTGDGNAEEAIKNRIQQLNLEIKDLEVDVNADTAILRGEATSSDIREKAVLAAGNIKDIAKVEALIAVRENTQQDDSEFYQVKSGDTLSKISKEYYGDASKYHKIFEANKPMLSDPDKIYPGQTLRIPEAQKQQAA